jgi:hypothetical protein
VSELAALANAAISAGLAGALPWWRVQDILDHVDQVDQLAERGIVNPLRWPSAPSVPVPAGEARRRAIAAEWAALSARIARRAELAQPDDLEAAV